MQDNDAAQNVFDDKFKKFDRSERQLDCAQTNMQDTLESIRVLLNRQIEYSNCNSSKTTDSASNEDEENLRRNDVEVEQLRNALSSKDKLVSN